MVKVGDRVRVTLHDDNPGKTAWDGEYTVYDLRGVDARRVTLMKEIFNIDYTNAIGVNHPKFGLGDILADEYEVIEND